MAKITEKGFKKIEYTDIADVPKAINDNIDNVESIIDDLEKPTFEEATNRSNIVSGETISVLFGKIKKFFTESLIQNFRIKRIQQITKGLDYDTSTLSSIKSFTGSQK